MVWYGPGPELDNNIIEASFTGIFVRLFVKRISLFKHQKLKAFEKNILNYEQTVIKYFFEQISQILKF